MLDALRSLLAPQKSKLRAVYYGVRQKLVDAFRSYGEP